MWLLVAVSLVAGTVSLAVGVQPSTDAWGWVVWGREIPRLDLDTTAGPSWKPLPVLFTVPLSVFGDAAPALWLVVSWAGGLLGLVLAYRVAARLAGRLAGAVAVLALLLTPGPYTGTSYPLAVLAGHSEPLFVALLLWALERQLAGGRTEAFVLVFLAALARPEVWPVLGVAGVALWRRHPARRPLVGALLLLVPLLWFGGDWWGSGDPLTGMQRARGGEQANLRADRLVERPLKSLRHAIELVPVVVWALAGAAVGWAERRVAAARAEGVAVGPYERGAAITLGLAAAAVGWIAVVVAMAVVGYVGAPRLMLPAAALLSVLAGAGAGWLVAGAARLDRRGALLMGAGITVGAAVPVVVAATGLHWFAGAVATAVAGLTGAGVGWLVEGSKGGPREARSTSLPRTFARWPRLATAVLLTLAAAPSLVARVEGMIPPAQELAEKSAMQRDLRAVLRRAGGRPVVFACGRVASFSSHQTTIAGELDIPIPAVSRHLPPPRFELLLRDAPPGDPPRRGRLVARSERWEVRAVGCQPPRRPPLSARARTASY